MNNTKKQINFSDVKRFLGAIWVKGEVRELRIFSKDGKQGTGYFNSYAAVERALKGLQGDWTIYVTLNPCNKVLLSRYNNKFEFSGYGKKLVSTSDKDIVSLQYLLIDVEKSRPANTAASDSELQKTKQIAEAIRSALGTPLLYAMSGNGYHLVYKHNLSSNDKESVERLKTYLTALNRQHGSAQADGHYGVDISVHNPSRISKVIGTWSLKGNDELEEFPHRRSYIIETNKGNDVVLNIPEVAKGTATKSTTNKAFANKTVQDSYTTVEQALSANAIEYTVDEKSFGRCYILRSGCLFDASHQGKDAMILVHADGCINYKCFHNSCRSYTWKEAKEKLSIFTNKGNSSCKNCNEPITWAEVGGKNVPFNPDGTKHTLSCAARRKKQVGRTVSVKVTEKTPVPINVPPSVEPVQNIDSVEATDVTNEQTATYEPVKPPFTKVIKTVGTFVVAKEGVFANNDSQWVKILSQPVQITKTFRNYHTGETFAQLEWDNIVEKVGVGTLLQSNKHSVLGDMGIYATDIRKHQIVQYFAVALDECEEKQQTVDRNGWLRNDCFVLGKQLVFVDHTEAVHFDNPFYEPATGGKLSTWVNIIQEFMFDAEIALKMGASAISPFIQRLGCPSFTFHTWGDTGSCKTTGTHLAASIWAKPSQIKEDWKGSAAGFECLYEEAGGLPIFLEEAHKAKPERVVQTVYDFGNGKQAPKADMSSGKRKRRAATKIAGIQISTGEHKISTLTADGGNESRIVEQHKTKIVRPGFGKVIEKNTELLESHYGHMGVPLIQYFLNNEQKLKEMYENIKEYLRTLVDEGTIEARKIPYFSACLLGCGMLVSCGCPMPHQDALYAACQSVMETKPVTLFDKSYEFVHSLAFSHAKQLVDKNSLISIPDGQTAIGFIDRKKEQISFVTTEFKRLCKEYDFEVSSLLAALDNKNLLEKTKSKGMAHVIKHGHITHTCYTIKLNKGFENDDVDKVESTEQK